MLLNRSEFRRSAIRMTEHGRGHIGVDFETTGLSPYRGDVAFILGFTEVDGTKFSTYLDAGMKAEIELFFSNPNLLYCAHNANFEVSFLKQQFGAEIKGKIWDTFIMEKVRYNNHKKYGLQACAERFGESKYPPMLEWLAKRGNKGQYHIAPKDIIEPYVEHDAWLSWELTRQQIETFKHWDQSSRVPIKPVVSLEIKTQRHIHKMEEKGLRVDTDYCRAALEYERTKADEAKKEFYDLTGVEFVDSRKTLEPVFVAAGIGFGRTGKGNASFTEESITGDLSHPIVRALFKYRNANKRASSYWQNFLDLEVNGRIHPSIHQTQAKTGRMSISDPSCQNWATDDDDPKYPIRRAFLADPGCVIVSIDYSQMELRLMCDEAEDMGMIDAIKSGTDFHQQVADQAGVSRSLAKNGRFAKLYGAGVKKVAETLKIPVAQAKSICEAIDDTSPKVKKYAYELIKSAENSPFGYNFLGRRFYFDKGFEYKFSNYRIQSGCGEILRLAICGCGELLEKEASPNSYMMIPIHDELVFNLDRNDLPLIPKLVKTMIAAHTSRKHLDMDVAVSIGENFYDLKEFKVDE